MNTNVVMKETSVDEELRFYCPKTDTEISQFYEKNARLIHAMLKSYRGLDCYDDLFQEASIGFFKGIKSYSPTKGVKLTTYAYECARNEVKMYLRRSRASCRTAILVPLEAGPADMDSDPHFSALNQDLSDVDTLHPATEDMEEMIARKDLYNKAMSIVENDMTLDQQTVIKRHMDGIPQSETAEYMNISQSQVSKILKQAMCELVNTMRERGLM